MDLRLNWSKFLALNILLAVLLQFWCPSLWAKPTNTEQAKKMVRGWLKIDARPLGTKLGQKIDKVDSFTDNAGNVIYYVVYLRPSGFVIVPSDDTVEPIICFVPKGISYDPSPSNPLGALVSGDMPNRIAAARNLTASAKKGTQKNNSSNNIAALRKASLNAMDKWMKFSNYDVEITGSSSISDVRVEPLLQNTWGQTTIGDYIGGTSCYNYYTPPYAAGTSNNYSCGCVATAMAQLIRYHQHQPVGGVGLPYLGGNGSGGPYIWSNMPLQPAVGTTTTTECQAIGALCYDVAESINTIYGSGGSSATLYDPDQELVNTFGYSNSIYYSNYLSDIPTATRNTMINPNLDAGYPAILGLRRTGSGHAVLCDGYGYNGSTLYHHLNMGWSGTDNAWYNLPNVDASYNYDTVDTCVYNVFTSGSGEIISGRITNLAGQPISDVNITATGGGVYSTTTNSKGIYALANVPSNTSFTLTAGKGSWSFSNNNTSTGKSTDYSGTPGNKWGINFTGLISAGFVEFDKEVYLPGETIIITVVDSDLIGYVFASVLVTTSGGDEELLLLSESPVGSGCFTTSVPSNQAAVTTGDGVIQLDYNQTMTATYQDADDGTGNPATSQDTAITLTMLLGTDFTGGIPAGWSIINGGSTSDTWTSTNPGGRSNEYLNGTFMIADSDYAGQGTSMDEQLITPNLDCSSLENVTLEFTHHFWFYYDTEDIGDVDVRVNSGPWQNLVQYYRNDVSGLVKLDISSIADGQSNVQIRWHYYNAFWGHYWGIDNVTVTGISSVVAPQTRIYGKKWHDLNDNGQIDDGEPPLSEWTIFLDQNYNGNIDTNDIVTTTDAQGNYEFTGMEPNKYYYVSEEDQAGWINTYPGAGGIHYRLWVAENNDVVANFGNYQLHNCNISGYKFHDVNNNAVFDNGDVPLSGWDIYIDLNENGQWDSGEPITTTNASGYYEFTNLSPGYYNIMEVPQTGWSQTYPGITSGRLWAVDNNDAAEVTDIIELDPVTMTVINSFTAPYDSDLIGHCAFTAGPGTLFYCPLDWDSEPQIQSRFFEIDPETGSIVDEGVFDLPGDEFAWTCAWHKGILYVTSTDNLQANPPIVYLNRYDASTKELISRDLLVEGAGNDLTSDPYKDLLLSKITVPTSVYEINPDTAALVKIIKQQYPLKLNITYTRGVLYKNYWNMDEILISHREDGSQISLIDYDENLTLDGLAGGIGVTGGHRVWIGKTNIQANFANMPVDITAELNLDNLWMYQNLPGQTASDLTAAVSITDDPTSNSSYTYQWEFILPSDVNKAPATVAGGGINDASWTFAALSCNDSNGLSDSGQTFTVRVTVTGNDYGNTGIAEAQFAIALLGDASNDSVVNVADRSIVNAFWRTGSAGAFTLRDCDMNCDGVVNVADRSIANAIWRGTLGRNSVTNPCPLR